MSRRRREWGTCEECGAPEFRRRKYGVPFLCYECATRRISTAAIEMVEKRGPAWDAWCASNASGRPDPGA